MSQPTGKPDRRWEWNRWILGLPGHPEQPPKTGVRGQLVQHPIRTLLIVLGFFATAMLGSYWLLGNPALSADHEAVAGTLEFDGIVCCPVYREIDGAGYVFAPAMKDGGAFNTGFPRDLALRVVRLGDDGAPEEVASLDAPIESYLPNSAALVGSTVYVPLGTSDEDPYGLWRIDVSDPVSPSDAGLIDVEHRYTSVTAGEDDLLIAHASGHFDVYDGTDPGDLSLITSYRRPIRDVQRMQVLDGELYYLESGTNRVRIDDIKDLENPEPLGRYEVDGVRDQRFARRSGRINSAEDRFDASVPQGRFQDFTVAGDELYVAASDTGVQTVDISDPSATDKVGGIQPDGRAARTTIMDDDLFVVTADEESSQRLAYEVHRYGLSDPARPERLDVIDGIKAVPGQQAIGTGGGKLFLGLGDSLLVLAPGD